MCVCVGGVCVYVWACECIFCSPKDKTEVVTMPSDQYSLELTNATVASLDVPTSNVTGLVIGHTDIVLQDKRIQQF